MRNTKDCKRKREKNGGGSVSSRGIDEKTKMHSFSLPLSLRSLAASLWFSSRGRQHKIELNQEACRFELVGGGDKKRRQPKPTLPMLSLAPLPKKARNFFFLLSKENLSFPFLSLSSRCSRASRLPKTHPDVEHKSLPLPAARWGSRMRTEGPAPGDESIAGGGFRAPPRSAWRS